MVLTVKETQEIEQRAGYMVRGARVSAGGNSLSSPGGRQESGLRTDPLVLPPERSPFVHLRCLSAALHRQHVSDRSASRVDGSPQAESVSYGYHDFLYEAPREKLPSSQSIDLHLQRDRCGRLEMKSSLEQ
ncbi:unnamed protein product, partial [Rangifer tarandus platyrhynchus]